MHVRIGPFCTLRLHDSGWVCTFADWLSAYRQCANFHFQLALRAETSRHDGAANRRPDRSEPAVHRASVEAELRKLAEERGVKAGPLINASRASVTGQGVGPA